MRRTITDARGLADSCDVILECAVAAFAQIADAVIDCGRIFVPPAGGLLKLPDLTERARQSGARIIVPTGALLGLDAVRAAAEGTIHSSRVVSSRKLPRPGWRAASGGQQRRHQHLSEPLLVPEGSGTGPPAFRRP
ncbi:MAG: hypothetical protein R3E68_04315 [Burkholderiaceae bacterium]